MTGERERPTHAELEAVLASLPPDEAEEVRGRTSPAPPDPRPEALGVVRPAPVFTSWQDYVERTSEADRRRWCALKARKANAPRLMSGTPEHKLTPDDVLAVLVAAQGRCALRLAGCGEPSVKA